MTPRRIRHKPIRKDYDEDSDTDRLGDGGFEKKQGEATGEEYRRVKRPFVEAETVVTSRN